MLLERISGRVISIPSSAVLVERGLIRRGNAILEIVRPFKEVNTETPGYVPGNMAMHEPGAGIVRLEGQDEPAPCREHGHVAADRVVRLEIGPVGARVVDVTGLAPRSGRGRAPDDDKIVPVKVNWMLCSRSASFYFLNL